MTLCHILPERRGWVNRIDRIISEFSKLAQKEYKARHDWVGKVIYWEMSKKFKCQQMVYAQPSTCPRKWHTQTPMGLWYTNGSPNLDPKTRPYNNQQKICPIVDFAVPADHRIRLKECEKRDKYLDLEREFKKLRNMKVTIIPIVIGAFGTVTKGLFSGRFGSWRPSRDHPNNSIIENGQYTEKSPGDLRRLAVTQSPMKDHQMSLMWKTLMSNNNNNDNAQSKKLKEPIYIET